MRFPRSLLNNIAYSQCGGGSQASCGEYDSSRILHFIDICGPSEASPGPLE